MPIANYFPRFTFVSLVSKISIFVCTVIVLLQCKYVIFSYLQNRAVKMYPTNKNRTMI